MKVGSLFIVPLGCLGTRMRVIQHWAALARALGRRADIIWGGCPEFGDTAFHELFETPRFGGVVSRENWEPANTDYLDLSLWMGRSKKSAPFREQFLRPSLDSLAAGGPFKYQNLLYEGEHIPSETGYRTQIRPEFTFPLEEIAPNAEMLHQIERITRQLSGSTIGLNIRQMPSGELFGRSELDSPPLERWHRAIRESPESTSFYLATDSKAVEEEFITKHGAQIVSGFESSKGDKGERGGESNRAALVDLYCLAACCKTIGDPGSSFTIASDQLRSNSRQLDRIRVWCEYFHYDNKERRSEILTAITANLENAAVEAVFIFVERQDYARLAKSIADSKKSQIIVRDRLQIQEILEFASATDLNQTYVHVLLNSDISLPLDFGKNVKWLGVDEFWALTRWEWKDGSIFNRVDSQDTWVWRGRCRVEGARFFMGVPRCDGRLAYLGAIAYGRANVRNVCLDVKTWHHHSSSHRPGTSNQSLGFSVPGEILFLDHEVLPRNWERDQNPEDWTKGELPPQMSS